MEIQRLRRVKLRKETWGHLIVCALLQAAAPCRDRLSAVAGRDTHTHRDTNAHLYPFCCECARSRPGSGRSGSTGAGGRRARAPSGRSSTARAFYAVVILGGRAQRRAWQRRSFGVSLLLSACEKLQAGGQRRVGGGGSFSAASLLLGIRAEEQGPAEDHLQARANGPSPSPPRFSF